MIQCFTYNEARLEAIHALSDISSDIIKEVKITFDGVYYWVERIYVEDIDAWPI